MAHVKVANRHGTAAQLAELAGEGFGYSDGVGMYTHESARARKSSVKFPVRTLTTRQRIDKEERELRALQVAHRTLTDSVKLLRNERDQNARTNFLEKTLWPSLAAELRGKP